MAIPITAVLVVTFGLGFWHFTRFALVVTGVRKGNLPETWRVFFYIAFCGIVLAWFDLSGAAKGVIIGATAAGVLYESTASALERLVQRVPWWFGTGVFVVSLLLFVSAGWESGLIAASDQLLPAEGVATGLAGMLGLVLLVTAIRMIKKQVQGKPVNITK